MVPFRSSISASKYSFFSSIFPQCRACPQLGKVPLNHLLRLIGCADGPVHAVRTHPHAGTKMAVGHTLICAMASRLCHGSHRRRQYQEGKRQQVPGYASPVLLRERVPDRPGPALGPLLPHRTVTAVAATVTRAATVTAAPHHPRAATPAGGRTPAGSAHHPSRTPGGQALFLSRSLDLRPKVTDLSGASLP